MAEVGATPPCLTELRPTPGKEEEGRERDGRRLLGPHPTVACGPSGSQLPWPEPQGSSSDVPFRLLGGGEVEDDPFRGSTTRRCSTQALNESHPWDPLRRAAHVLNKWAAM